MVGSIQFHYGANLLLTVGYDVTFKVTIRLFVSPENYCFGDVENDE